MLSDAHLSIAPAVVREGSLARHAGHRLGRATYALAGATGQPRLWSFAHRAALKGFAHGMDTGRALEGASVLGHAFQQARQALAGALNGLVERTLPDVALLAVHVDRDGLHVMSVGDCRAYLHRGAKAPGRMTPRETNPHGLLEGEPTYVSISAEPTDLLLAGSASAFSASAVGRVATALQSDPHLAPSVLAAVLVEPAGRAGIGAVALALRIR